MLLSVALQDVYVVAGPVLQGPYSPDRDKRLLRAAKKRHLDAVDSSDWLGMPDTGSFLENLITTIMNNLQVFIRNVHIRYEDTLMHPDPDVTLTCGICLFNLSVEFTNKYVSHPRSHHFFTESRWDMKLTHFEKVQKSIKFVVAPISFLRRKLHSTNPQQC